MLDLYLRINGLGDFINTHIQPDLPELMNIYIQKTDLIYLVTSWKGTSGPTILPRSAEGVQSLAALLTYYQVKSKKPVNFFLVLEIPREVTKSDTGESQLPQRSVKKQKVFVKKEKIYSPLATIKNEPNTFTYAAGDIKVDPYIDSMVKIVKDHLDFRESIQNKGSSPSNSDVTTNDDIPSSSEVYINFLLNLFII